MKKYLLSLIFLLTILLQNKAYPQGDKQIEIHSPTFENNELIPKDYTCDGKDISPPLSWSGIPENTKSLVLICDDPDAPMGTWVHWVIYNMPPASKGLQEGVIPLPDLPYDTKQGINDFKKVGYSGPCPPSGTHRYFFKLYALNTKLNLKSNATKNQLLAAMKGHILSQTELIGKYKR